MTEENVCFVVAGGEFDVFRGGSGFEQDFDGLGGAATGPVGVDGGFDGELERSAASSVAGIDEGSTGDEEFYSFGPGAPCGYVEGGAVSGDVEVWVAGVKGSDGNAEVEEIADTFGVAVAGEFGEDGSCFGVQVVQDIDGAALDGGLIVPGAGGEEALEWVAPGDDESGGVEGDESALLEEGQDVASASARGYVNCGLASAGFEGGVGSVVEE